jgi:hypothetical protein
MEGRITTPPTTLGVRKGARQSKAQRQCETRDSVTKSSRMCVYPDFHDASGVKSSSSSPPGISILGAAKILQDNGYLLQL